MAKSFEIVGDVELKNLIDKLPSIASQRRVWRSLARKASRPIIESVRSKVPVDEGDLKRSVKYVNYPSRYHNGLGGFVKFSSRSKSKTFSNPAKGSVLTNNRTVKPLHKTYRNFFDEAADDSGREALAEMERSGIKFLEREINKLVR